MGIVGLSVCTVFLFTAGLLSSGIKTMDFLRFDGLPSVVSAV